MGLQGTTGGNGEAEGDAEAAPSPTLLATELVPLLTLVLRT